MILSVLIADAICNMAGLGFRGYDETGKAQWDLVTNVKPLDLEFGRNPREQVQAWNIGTTIWLKRYCIVCNVYCVCMYCIVYILYYTVLYCVYSVLYCTVLCVYLYCTVCVYILYYTVLCVYLYCTVLYCVYTILYCMCVYTVLYCIVCNCCRCVYDRIGFYPNFSTWILSAFWHGLYPGYHLSFIVFAFATLTARKVRVVVTMLAGLIH